MVRCNCFLTLVVVLVACNTQGAAESKKGCGAAKASVNTKRSIISNGRLNLDISAIERGVKRSIPEDNGESDCDNAKKSNVEIKEAAVSAIPGQNEESVITSEKNAKKSNVNKDSHEYLVLPTKKAVVEKERKDKLEKPNKKHSPLWSLSKLIENTDAKGAKKANVVPQKTSLKIEKGSTKSNMATSADPAKAIKATLSKAIEKVEKVIANKNANLIKTGDSRTKSGSDSSKSSKSDSKPSSPMKMAAPAAPKDPYAEIAMGPDRPKIPELKSDAGDSNPVMKMANGEMKPVSSSGSASDPAMRNAKPLAGEHDVGGLLDRLTDKLNSGGGGVAMDSSPLASDTNEVKYVQSQLTDEAGDKQAQEFAVDKLKDQADMSEVKKMTEQDGMFAGGPSEGTTAASASSDSTGDLSAALASKSENSASAAGGSSSSSAAADELRAALAKSQSTTAVGSESAESAESTAALAGAGGTSDDDGIAKSLSKAGSMSTEAVMDLLKSGKVSGSDFSNADISTGPDPYANTAESQQSTQATDDSLSSLIGGSKPTDSASEDSLGGAGGLDAASLSSLMGSSKEVGAADDSAEATGLDSAGAGGLDSSELTGGLGGLADSSDSGLTGTSPDGDLGSRSTESAPADSESDSEFERNTIPSDESYRNRYNTEIFKKHTIMRPKRDTYQSPFNSKEAFDTAI